MVRYLSKDDFRNRTKASKTVVDYMADLGLFGDLRSPISCHYLIFNRQNG